MIHRFFLLSDGAQTRDTQPLLRIQGLLICFMDYRSNLWVSVSSSVNGKVGPQGPEELFQIHKRQSTHVEWVPDGNVFSDLGGLGQTEQSEDGIEGKDWSHTHSLRVVRNHSRETNHMAGDNVPRGTHWPGGGDHSPVNDGGTAHSCLRHRALCRLWALRLGRASLGGSLQACVSRQHWEAGAPWLSRWEDNEAASWAPPVCLLHGLILTCVPYCTVIMHVTGLVHSSR